MDVRWLDTSALEVKRIEMERVRAVQSKDESGTDHRVGARKADKDGKKNNPHKEEPDEPDDETPVAEQHAEETPLYESHGISTGSESTDNHGEGHLFDALA